MPLSNDYWEKRTQEMQAAPTQPKAYSPQREVNTGLQQAVEKAETEQYRREAAIPVKARFVPEIARQVYPNLPDRLTWETMDKSYIVMNEMYDMPEQAVWSNMGFWEKRAHMQKEGAKLSWKAIKGAAGFVTGIPKHIIKSPLNLTQSAFDLASRGIVNIADITGMDRAKAEKIWRYDPSYSLPWLGEIRGVGMTYDESRARNISPFFSALAATGDFAGNLAMALTGINFAGSVRNYLTMPRMVKVKGTPVVTGKDFRPLAAEQIEPIKAKAKEAVITTGKEVKFGPVKQNPNIEYVPMSNQAAKIVGGNRNNTFMKFVPDGKGMAKMSIVRRQKALTDRTKDWFKNKYGRSKIVEGAKGPEIELYSEYIKYDSTALVKKGSKTPANAEARASAIGGLGGEVVAGEKFIAEMQASRAPITPDTVDPFTQKKPDIPSIMAKPLKGFGDKLTTEKQINQIINLLDDRGLDAEVAKAISSSFNGKENLYELTQNELYEVSEVLRSFPQPGKEPAVFDFDSKYNITWIAQNKTWMDQVETRAAEEGFNYPVGSEVRIPIETGIGLSRPFRDGWHQNFREWLGKYTRPKYLEERRLISEYVEGNKDIILKNDALTSEIKKELADTGEKFINFFKESWEAKDLGMTMTRFFEHYLPKIRKAGGINFLYKESNMPPELKVFAQFEREGQLNVLEDDILVLADVYAAAVAKVKFIKKPYDHAQKVMAKLPPNIKDATNDWVQEVMGRKDEAVKALAKFGERLSKKTWGIVPKDIFHSIFQKGMSFTYAGALGLPRAMPPVRNLVGQSVILPFAQFGPEWFTHLVKSAHPNEGQRQIKQIIDMGLEVRGGVMYGSELGKATGRGPVGKAIDIYEKAGIYSMKPYSWSDLKNRALTLDFVLKTFNKNWSLYKDGKINYNELEAAIDINSFSQTAQKVIREHLMEQTDESLDAARRLLGKETLDEIQFGYRKGSASRLHHGLRGKVVGQFSQYTWGYTGMVRNWVVRKQWDKLVRWLGMSEAIKRSFADELGIDISKWVGLGPIAFPISPLTRIMTLAIGGVENSLNNYVRELNENYQEIMRSLGIFGGILPGVGAQKWKKVKESVDIYEATIAGRNPFGLPQDPTNKDRIFGLWTRPIAKGAAPSLKRPVTFWELMKYGFGFEDIEGKKMWDALDVEHKQTREKQIAEKRALKFLMDGEFDKYQNFVIDNKLDFEPAKRADSFQKSILQRRWESLSQLDKVKYYHLFIPVLTGQ